MLARALLACALTTPALADPARLELRIIAQSGVPAPGGGTPQGCVFDDSPGVVAITPGTLKRFEVQARVVDTDAGDGLTPAGPVSTTFSIASSRDGLWGRAVLSAQESTTIADPPALSTGADCSGAAVAALRRGVHVAYRAWEPLGVPLNEDARNGALAPGGVSGVRIAAAGDAIVGEGRWVGLYSFEFTLGTGQTGDTGLSVRAETSGGWAFVWTTTSGAVRDGNAWTGTGLLLRAPAAPAPCCARGDCYIALTPTACFANGGRLAGGACTAGACCAADFSGHHGATVQDVFDFLTAYLTADPRADINRDGAVTLQDVFDFVGAWYAGCA
jgi:hypothetical protein